MKTPFIILSFVFALLASCTSVSTVSGLNKNDLRNLKLTDLRGSKVPIVEVKKGSLKEVKSGQEKYLAYNRSQKSARRSVASTPSGDFFAPKDFDPADLPSGVGMPSFGLLPPLNPGSSTSTNSDASSDGLEGLTPDSPPEIPADLPTAETLPETD